MRRNSPSLPVWLLTLFSAPFVLDTFSVANHRNSYAHASFFGVNYQRFRWFSQEAHPVATTKEELERFSQFARQQLSAEGADLSLDELFDRWRAENPSDELYAENVAAVSAAIDDYRNGDRGTAAGEHSDQLRREFGSKVE